MYGEVIVAFVMTVCGFRYPLGEVDRDAALLVLGSADGNRVADFEGGGGGLVGLEAEEGET